VFARIRTFSPNRGRCAQLGNFYGTLWISPTANILLPTGRHAELLSVLVSDTPHLRGNILRDAHTAVLMREHGIREIYTRDTNFHRFPFLKVIDPVAG
jgi:predicted nucleic acid-binding protein